MEKKGAKPMRSVVVAGMVLALVGAGAVQAEGKHGAHRDHLHKQGVVMVPVEGPERTQVAQVAPQGAAAGAAAMLMGVDRGRAARVALAPAAGVFAVPLSLGTVAAPVAVAPVAAVAAAPVAPVAATAVVAPVAAPVQVFSGATVLGAQVVCSQYVTAVPASAVLVR